MAITSDDIGTATSTNLVTTLLTAYVIDVLIPAVIDLSDQLEDIVRQRERTRYWLTRSDRYVAPFTSTRRSLKCS
jgi:hypothetical protein